MTKLLLPEVKDDIVCRSLRSIGLWVFMVLLLGFLKLTYSLKAPKVYKSWRLVSQGSSQVNFLQVSQDRSHFKSFSIETEQGFSPYKDSAPLRKYLNMFALTSFKYLMSNQEPFPVAYQRSVSTSGAQVTALVLLAKKVRNIRV